MGDLSVKLRDLSALSDSSKGHLTGRSCGLDLKEEEECINRLIRTCLGRPWQSSG